MSRVRRALREGGISLAAVRALRYASELVAVRAASRTLPRLAAQARDVDAAIDLAEGFEFGGVRIVLWQVREEIAALLRRLEEDPPRTVLEIGTAGGGTIFLFARVAAADALLVTVDLPWRGPGVGYHPVRERLYRSFAGERQKVRLVRVDSHTEEGLAEVRRALGDRSVDFLFIDGDHGYDGVRRDFELYAPLVRPGGLIAFHDIVPGPPESSGDVPRFWRELRTHHDTEELVGDWEQGMAGIGLLRVARV